MSDPGPPGDRFDLADLVDLEVRIADDAPLDDAALAARDRPIAERLGPLARTSLLKGWLDALRATRPMPGERIARSLRASRMVCIIAGLVTGWSTATWLLLYDGLVINVVQALVVLVGLQTALLLGLMLMYGARRLGLGAGRGGDLRAVVGWIARMIDTGLARLDDRWHARDAEGRARLATVWHRLRARRSLYRDVEQTHVLATLQAFGVAFNVAVVIAIVRAASLFDLSFGWMTSLDLDPAAAAGFLRALSMPWAWAWPEAVPTVELVDTSLYSRRLGRYLIEVGQPVAGTGAAKLMFAPWWRFLLMSVAVYGFVPRFALWIWSLRRSHRALAELPLDTPDVDRIVRRLTIRRVETRAPEPETVEAPAARTLEPEYAEPAPAERWTVIAWRDFPLDRPRIEATIDAYAGALAATHEVNDFAAQATVLAAVGEAERIMVLAETFEAPDKAVRRFLVALREAVGPTCPVVVGLIAEAAETGWTPIDRDTLALWQQHLAMTEDPYLGVEALGARP